MEAKAVEAKSSFISPGELLKNSWEVYKAHWKKLLLLAALPYIALIPFVLVAGVLVALGFFLFSSQNIIALIMLIVFGGVLAGLYLFIVFSIGSLAMMYQIADIKKSMSIKGLLQKGWRSIWAYGLLILLNYLIVTGGLVLLIIPGIILSIGFTFAIYILVTEGTKSWEALIKSREYVRGNWWGVLGRILLLSILIYAIIWILTMIFGSKDNEGIGVFLQFFVSIIATPFTVIYSYLMYESLKKNKPSVAKVTPSKSTLNNYKILTAIGLLPLVIMAILFATILYQSLNQYQQNPDMFDPGQFEEVVPTNTSQLIPPLEES